MIERRTAVRQRIGSQSLDDIAPLRLYCSFRSPFARKTLIALEELSLMPHVTCIPTRVPSANLDPAFVASNPMGQLPTLVLRDGTSIYDSTVICEWLDNLIGKGSLIPAEPLRRLDCQKREALGNGMILKSARWWQEICRPKEKISQSNIEGLRRTINRVLNAIEQHALAWDAQSIDAGGIAIACALSYLDYRFSQESWREQRPNLAGWYAVIAARPSLLAHPLNDHGNPSSVPMSGGST